MNKENYFGVSVSSYDYEGIIDDIRHRMEEGENSTIIAVNPEKVMAAEENPELMELINAATYQIPDGIGIILASKLKRGSIRSRVTGVDMMARLLKFAAEEGHRVFMYGAKPEVVTQAAENIQKKYPAITIAGTQHGYEQDQSKVVAKINESKADILFVAMGSPRQELWIREHMDGLHAKVFQGVGGSFDVFAGHVQRAPKVYRDMGLEWFYRLMKEPQRFKRQLALPKFLAKVLFSK